jgi:hypothetical protein
VPPPLIPAALEPLEPLAPTLELPEPPAKELPALPVVCPPLPDAALCPSFTLDELPALPLELTLPEVPPFAAPLPASDPEPEQAQIGKPRNNGKLQR